MIKFVMLAAALFTLAILSPIGKIFTDAVTTNYTFSLISGNLSSIGWYVAYMRSYWWIMPLAVLVLIIIQFMKKDEPEPYFPPPMPQLTVQRPPRQKKQKVVQQNPKPPIFFGK